MNSPDTQSTAPASPKPSDTTRLDFADSSFFYDLFWHSPEALAVAIPETVTYGPVNPAYAHMHGYQPGELEGQPLGCLYPPECHEEMHRGIACANRTGFHEWETLHVRKDGSVFPVSMKLRVVRDAHGQVRFRLASAQDITQRKRLEEQAGRTQRLLEGIAANSSAAISVKDQDGRYLLSNPLSDAGLGVPPGGALGKTDHEIFPPHYADQFRANDLAVLQSGRPQESEETAPGVDGDRVYLCFKFPLRDGSGAAYATGLIATDITERRRIQAELERSRQQLQAIADSMPDALQVYDLLNQRSVFSNRGVGALLGYTPHDMLAMGRDINRILLHPDDYDRVQADDLTYRTLKDGEVFEHSFRMRHTDGSYRWLRSRGAAFERDANGGVTHIIATAQDITEQREQQARIEDLNVRLRRAMKETHHRVKNNLQVIASLAEMQMDAEADKIGGETNEVCGAVSGGGVQANLQGLRRIAQHIHSLAALHDLLTHNATLDESAGVVSARDLLKKLLPLLQPVDGVRRLRSRIDEIFFSSRTAAPFALLVNELVSNALKHGRGDITVTLRRNDTLACLEVRDQGPGFSPGFDPRRAAHTGLELIDSLVRYDLHGQVMYANAADDADDANAGGTPDAQDIDLPAGGRVVVTFPIVSPVLEGC